MFLVWPDSVYNSGMNIELLFFLAGLCVGGLICYFYSEKNAKNRGDRNLTIEAIVHEIKTPLTALSWIFNSLSELKQNDTLNEDNFNLIKEGESKVSVAIGLANDALAALNTSVDYASYKFENHNLIEIINKVIAENSLGAKGKSIVINFNESNETLFFLFDSIKMTLAIRNLVTNAIKYTPAGGIVTITARKDGKDAIVVVTDTGIGIPETDLGKIAGKFFRAKNIGEVSGSGLGLFIVKNIVAGHGGKMDIQSKEGKGTKITLFLPIK